MHHAETRERPLQKELLGLVWYCCDFLKAVELSGPSKSCSQKVIVVPFDKIM